MKLAGALLLVLINVAAFGQDTIRYKSLLAETVGENVSIKYRSVVTGQKTTAHLKNGRWLAIDSLGNTLIEVNYKANKSAKLTRKHGLEIYYEPETGDTILIRNYHKGTITNQLGFKNGIIDNGGRIIHVFKDFESFTVWEYKKKLKNHIPMDLMSQWSSTYQNPNGTMTDSAYRSFEDSVGNSELVNDQNTNTKHPYNYISNPEFEIHPKAPFTIMSFTNQVPGWEIASESPDFYIAPRVSHSGSSFVGFRVFSMQKHIEYLQNELKQPLEKDSVYCFSAFLKLSPASRYATNAFGFKLSQDKVSINTDELLTIEPSKGLNDQVLNYKTRWMKVQCSYKAIGGERYLVIGSFQNHHDLNLISVDGEAQESYYFMDDVSLVPAGSSDCGCNFEGVSEDEEPAKEGGLFTDLKVGDQLILDDIHFENDEAELLPESFQTLGELLEALLGNNAMRIELSGHTSDVGDYDHNMDLSLRRAKAVRSFLTLNGIDESRIEIKGFGPDYPIADNSTKQGQLLNRRVEFKVLGV